MCRYASPFLDGCELVREMGEIKYARVRDIVGANSLVIDSTSRVIHVPGDGAPGARTVKPSENSAAFSERRVSNSLFQFIYFKIGSYADAKRQRKSFPGPQ